MAGLSDNELIGEIQAGHPNALGTLFNRYSPALYEFIYLLIGEREQAARLLEQTFIRAYSLSNEFSRGSVRGWLYNLARENAISYLREKNWLSALPVSDDLVATGLPADIWRAARAMPAFHRAVLIVEELHGLSPTEKAQALNVARTDLSYLIEEARHTFKYHFDALARQQGGPTVEQLDPERDWGMHRRVGNEGSLFAYLPESVLTDTLAATVLKDVLTATFPETAPPPAATPPDETTVPAPTQTFAPPTPISTLTPPAPPAQGCNARLLLISTTIAILIVGLSACAAYYFTRDTILPVISDVEPSDGSTVPVGARPRIHASYQDNRGVNVKSVVLVLDGRDVTAQALISDTSLNYSSDLDSGQHVVLVEVRDTSGNKSTKAWQFAVAAAPEPTATPTLTPTPSAIPTQTRLPTPTATPTRPPPPIINNFSANLTLVAPNTSVLLTWSVSNADIVFLNQEKVDPNGTRLVTPAKTTNYQLLANNAGGTVDRTITVTVQELPDLVVTDISVNTQNQLTFTVRNDGAADVTRNFVIQVTANDVVIEQDRPIAVFPAGQEMRLVVPNYTLLGAQVIAVRVNLLREVQEFNYNNNELVRAVTGATATPTNTTTRTPTVTPSSTPTPSRTPTP
jgi:DNA-directed RNA polymerase specialized sigma24 family protein